MRYSTANIKAQFSAAILVMIVLLLVNTNAMARPNIKMKTKQVETSTNIKLKVGENTKVWMNVYNLEGKYVAELMNEKRVKKGKAQIIEVDTSNWNVGTYKVEIRTESGAFWTKEMMITE